MHAQDIINLNNEKRKQLNPENLEYYVDMLGYIRLNGSKSEQQTEEVLLELIEHLLQAQEQGKSAKDVFGDDLKAYCDEVIEEIPDEKKSKNLLFITYLTLDLLGTVGIFIGFTSFILYSLFDLGSYSFSFPLGSAAVIILIDLLLLYIFIRVILKWLNSSAFKEKKTNKWLEFLQIWITVMILIGIAMAVFLLVPSFGLTIRIPHLVIAGIGVILYIVAKFLNKKYRITK